MTTRVMRSTVLRPGFRVRAFALAAIAISIYSANCASFLLNRSLSFERGRADLEVKTIPVGKFHFVYTEGGKGEAIVLIHGFAGEKDHWTRMARYLTDKYRVIAPDLPGHGENDRLPEENYSIPEQARRLHDFVHQIGLKRFHLVGNSMGGAISTYYASEYPEDVITLALFDSAGVKSPVKSELATYLEKGENPLVVKTRDDFDRLTAFTFVDPPYIPGVIKSYFTEKAIANKEFNEKIFSDISKDRGGVEGRLSKIQIRTLILWGDTDRVIHPSSAEVFHKGIKNSEVVIMKACGHGPMIERPQETADHYLKFLNKSASAK